jgi:hypothetical protein
MITELERIKEPPEIVDIDLVVFSGGGDAHAAYKIVRYLRSKCSTLRGICPLYAKSAATLLLLGCDFIVMGPQSELGPLDTQIDHPGTKVEDIIISALDHVGSVEYLAGVAQNLAFKIVGQIRREYGLTRLDSVTAGLDYAQKYIAPLVAQLDPSLLYQSYRELTVAEDYAVRILNSCMFADADDQDTKVKIQNTVNDLVWSYNTHGFVIDSEEAIRLGIKIKPHTEYDAWNAVWKLNQILLWRDSGNIEQIHLYDEEHFKELRQILEKGNDNDQETGE